MLATIQNHHLNGANMFGDYPEGSQQVILGMGCFWGAERILWKLAGVHVTSVGYAGGTDETPDYKRVCSGRTGHTEAVHVVFDPTVITFDELLKVFFENHDPTQGNRQGNDVGSQYRSALYVFSDEQLAAAKIAAGRYEEAYGRPLTTEIAIAPTYYPAEDYHQQYLAKNPQGYCNHGPTGVSCPIPQRVTVPAE
ncbi:MAG: peptide-methionine (S)-S-oxide reductase MsrA [Litorimonas sp.]